MIYFNHLSCLVPPSWCYCYAANSSCVTYDAVCDGVVNCPDGRDEWNCKYKCLLTKNLNQYGYIVIQNYTFMKTLKAIVT